jgi:hypothetical protein
MQAHRGLRCYRFVTSEKELRGQPGKISVIPIGIFEIQESPYHDFLSEK